MNKFALALAGSLMATAAIAQTTTPSTATPATPMRPAPGMTATPAAPTMGGTTGTPMGTTGSTMGTTGSTMGTTAGTAMSPAGTPGSMNRTNGTAAASGNTNQAVATTNANAPQPAHGRNSFTRGEARRRIEKEGFASVMDLKKDNMGVWRGTGTKDGGKVNVWLDYKGNVGQS